MILAKEKKKSNEKKLYIIYICIHYRNRYELWWIMNKSIDVRMKFMHWIHIIISLVRFVRRNTEIFVMEKNEIKKKKNVEKLQFCVNHSTSLFVYKFAIFSLSLDLFPHFPFVWMRQTLTGSVFSFFSWCIDILINRYGMENKLMRYTCTQQISFFFFFFWTSKKHF